ncbi:DUF2254 domain-containing protein [Ancylobacter defluvii]|uniref:DUF2254 domain-containing protein n=1 Tax=Ancylobacter defluvii TaxID=1282440 RepID=A0A9W6JVN5_9HYPH|nr:DUF2254 domain-containing protein [Ancylobacter defluvii]MBS7587167.1 DUF2254 domain-containing protein [Ancylobacter defluvii]GLK83481.1 hypothetical protein GCM10017653_15500 [Ancylobacter defluvii]
MRQWRIPTFYAIGSLIVALALPRVEYALLPDPSYGMSVASATAFMSAAASGIITFTAIIVSITFVIIQFSAIAYSPRLALWFVNRPQLYHALGIFIATFTFAMATLAWTDRYGSNFVPFLSTVVVLILLSASMIVFARLIQGVAQLQITEVLMLVGDMGREVLARQKSTSDHAGVATSQPPAWDAMERAPDRCRKLLHVGPPLSVRTIDADRLQSLATNYNGVIWLEISVGDTVLEGDTLLVASSAPPRIPESKLREAIDLGRDRTLEQDPRFSFRLLVDIALKALSPAINDPTTAVQALDQIEDLLRRLARQELSDLYRCDAHGRPCVLIPMPTWEDYLSLAFEEILQYSAASTQVSRRLRASLSNLGDIVTDPLRQTAVERFKHEIDALISPSVAARDDELPAQRRP